MRRVWLWTAVVLAGAGLGGFFVWDSSFGSQAEAPYRLASVERGTVIASVRATGTLNPVTTVLVGSQQSGLVVEILADYNSPVKAGQVVARLNSEQIKSRLDAAHAELAQAKADLAMRKAQLDKSRAALLRAEAASLDLKAQRERAEAQLAEANRNLERQTELTARAVGTQNALDQARTQAEVQRAALASADAQISSNKAEIVGLEADVVLADAQIESAQAVILQRNARLRDIEIDLSRTDIKSPVDGVVVKRDIELGQTVAASLSAPTLFTIAQDLREIDIHANIDEADVGRLKGGQDVTFTVNAYPNRTFGGTVRMVRLGAQTVSNVVTYTAVIGVDNEDLALLPGMTANLQIVTDERRDVLRVPNAALRFRPVAGAASTAIPTARRDVFPELEERGKAFQETRKRFIAEVKPNAEQLATIDRIVADARAELLNGMRNSGQNRREAFRTFRQTVQERIAAALDPERKAKFLALARDDRRPASRGADTGTPGRVHLLDREGRPQPASLRLGVTDGSHTEVLAGDVDEGTHVIVGGGPRGKAMAGSENGSPPRRSRGPRLF